MPEVWDSIVTVSIVVFWGVMVIFTTFTVAAFAAEKELGVSGHKAIEEYGIQKFNDFCRKNVLKYSTIWTDMFKRIGRWVDFDNDYKTMDLSFMESIIHNFKQLYDKGLVYEDYRVQPYSWCAQTPVSNFEVNLGYKDKTDTAITVLFKLKNQMNVLVWTTTPWTLPSNLMLAVGADIDYAMSCTNLYTENPYMMLTNNVVRPEDLSKYEGICDYFKLVGRTTDNETLLKMIHAY